MTQELYMFPRVYPNQPLYEFCRSGPNKVGLLFRQLGTSQELQVKYYTADLKPLLVLQMGRVEGRQKLRNTEIPCFPLVRCVDFNDDKLDQFIIEVKKSITCTLD